MAGAVIMTKLNWIDMYPVGTAVSIFAPTTGPRQWPCTVSSISGSKNEDVGLQLDFLDYNPFQSGTSIQLILIEAGVLAHGKKASHKVIAVGVTQ